MTPLPASTPTRRELWASQRIATSARQDERTSEVRAELRRKLRSSLVLVAACALFLFAMPAAAFAAPETATNPYIQLALYLGGLSLLPFAVMTLTSFLRIVVVLSFLRSGLGAQNVPPNIVIIALALFLSLFVMGPTLDAINVKAIQPVQKGKIEQDQAFSIAANELKKFMLLQVDGKNSRKEIGTFYRLAVQQEQRANRKLCRLDQDPRTDKCLVDLEKVTDPKQAIEQLPLRVIIPAFIISELKKAFIMGFAVLLPFLVIDLVISNILLSLGMMMLPPVVISLPFKVLLFVLAGGWTMVVEFLMKGFNY